MTEENDVPFTDDFRKFMWEKHRDTYTLILLGHLELITDELVKEFENWEG